MNDEISQPIEKYIVQALSEHDRDLLRHGAVLRYITPVLARAATGSDEAAKRLIGHPLLRGGARSTESGVWELPLPIRRELLAGWDHEASVVLKRIVDDPSLHDKSYHRLYARLASPGERKEALATLASEFEAALSEPDPDVGRAHDLLRLLDEWPISESAEAMQLQDALAPRLRRFARAARDCEATVKYLQRQFEERVRQLLLEDANQWILQVHASGGLGKTMFLRHLLGRICPPADLPVARIDFDYLAHLAVATTQPWRILLAIARQLDAQLPHSPFKFMLASYGEFQAQLFSEVHPRRRTTGAVDDAWLSDTAALDAAESTPRKFRTELASALGDRHLLVVLDTVENVLHTEGAQIGALLAALGEVRNGAEEEGPQGARVPGLRVILCGRFDLEETRSRADGTVQPRAQGFNEAWVGPADAVRTERVGDTELRIARDVISLELPGFSSEEAHTYLKDMCDLKDDEMRTAIVERCDGNPMKLSLFAEAVKSDPDLKTADIASFESVELFYLVDRVVDRIADGTVQWLLRWGVLPRVLTRVFVETVLWPALEQFAASRRDYDNPEKDNLRPPRHETPRWKIPDPETTRTAGAAHAAWDRLLDYASAASWVSVTDEFPDAVLFHPEVRDPLRRLLRKGGHPAYDDIHSRALTYWKKESGQMAGAARAAALRGVIFHAYQPWKGDRPVPSELFRELLQQFADDRSARGDIAAEVLNAAQLAEDDDTIDAPAPGDIAIAHVELAERLVHDAAKSGDPVDEVNLNAHLMAAENKLPATQGRRLGFLRAARSSARGDAARGWEELHAALSQPPPDENGGHPYHLELIVEWGSGLTPPTTALAHVRRLADTARGTRLESRAVAPLARCLLAAEKWREALDVARTCENRELEARALLGLGRAREVIQGDYPALRRAEAALLRYDPDAAMRFIASAPGSPESQLLAARSHMLRKESSEAMSLFSSALSGSDHVVATDALIQMSRFLIDASLHADAHSELQRIPPGAPMSVALRAAALEALATRKDGDPGRAVADLLKQARHRAMSDPAVPPSVLVDIELARLELERPGRLKLDDLMNALARMDTPGSRLLALRGLSRVSADPGRLLSPVARRLHTLAKPDADVAGEPAIVLGQAELARVAHQNESGQQMLRALLNEANSVVPTALRNAVDAALSRFKQDVVPNGADGAKPPGKPEPEDTFDPDISMQISSTDTPEPTIRVRVAVAPSDAHEFSDHSEIPAAGLDAYRLAAEPKSMLADLGRALVVDYVEEFYPRTWQLQFKDERAARLPWELATFHDRPLHAGAAIVRRPRAWSAPTQSGTAIAAVVHVHVGVERKDRGLVMEVVENAYVSAGCEARTRSRPEFGLEQVLHDSSIRVLHLVAEVAQRRSGAGLRLKSEHMKSEYVKKSRYSDVTAPLNLAEWLDDGYPRLLVLDLALHFSDTDAAEQLMLANSFCWKLTRSAPSISVICGVFGAANDRVPYLQELAKALGGGRRLVEAVGLVQNLELPMPAGKQHPLRAAVSLCSATPRLRFQLGGSP